MSVGAGGGAPGGWVRSERRGGRRAARRRSGQTLGADRAGSRGEENQMQEDVSYVCVCGVGCLVSVFVVVVCLSVLVCVYEEDRGTWN